MTIASKNPPKGWPRIAGSPVYSEAGKAIDWLCTAFGFEIRMKVDGEGGRIEHSELTLGGGMIMVGDVDRGRTWRKSPRQLDGANTQTMMVFVDDADAHCERARAAGAKIETEPKTSDYGDDFWSDRGYEAVDLEGHHWWFIQRLRDQKPKA
jgi:uncharacterized glyoxalase superfamily protein PhnB